MCETPPQEGIRHQQLPVPGRHPNQMWKTTVVDAFQHGGTVTESALEDWATHPIKTSVWLGNANIKLDFYLLRNQLLDNVPVEHWSFLSSVIKKIRWAQWMIPLYFQCLKKIFSICNRTIEERTIFNYISMKAGLQKTILISVCTEWPMLLKEKEKNPE